MRGNRVGAAALLCVLFVSGAFGVTVWRYEQALASNRAALLEIGERHTGEQAAIVFRQEHAAIDEYMVGHHSAVLQDVVVLRAEFERLTGRLVTGEAEAAAILQVERARVANRRLLAEFAQLRQEGRSGIREGDALHRYEAAVTVPLGVFAGLSRQSGRAVSQDAAKASWQALAVALFGAVLSFFAAAGFALFVSRLLARTERQAATLQLTLAQREAAEGALRESEDQLRQAQKMEAVGQLAGGVAHDFNNLLTVISGYSEFALARLNGGDPKLRNDIEQIAVAGERAAQLTGQLLAFSRRQTLQPVDFDLSEAVSGSESLLRRLIGEQIDILSSLEPQGCTVNADRGQVEQIVMNLAVNARDAMPNGGTLTIETETIRFAQAEAARRFQAPAGEYALLRVSDTGCGMDAETREHVFEPFYTTKAPGEGTGLGLATVFGIVGQNGGYLSLTSEPGAGTTFEILLPLRPATAAKAIPSAPPEMLGSERILLVEDEVIVRTLTCEMLEGKGYDVATAADGEEALSLLDDQPFDLVITDIVMPKLGGKQLAARLRRTHPGLPIIFVSGYAHDTQGDDLTAHDTFIQKPFSAHDLGLAVRTTLDTQHTAPVG